MMYSTNKIFTFLSSFILLWCSTVAMQEANAQCQTQITSITPTGVACPNETFTFTGTGQGVATSFDFNGATFPTGWVASAFTLAQPCNTPSPDGTNYFWSAAGGSGVSRFVQTSVIDASPGGSLIFDIDFGNDDPDPGCEEVDAGEGVFLQYSINGGTTWVDIQYFDPTDPSGGAIGYNWIQQTIPIPLLAQTVSTSFRWIQPNHSGTGFDNWGLDNISVTQVLPVTAHSWNFGDGSPLNTSGGTVSHSYASTGVYTVTYQGTILGGCTSSTTTTVTVSNPTITAPANISVPATLGCTAPLSGVSLGTPTTTSACTIVSSTTNAPDPLPIGPTVVTWTSTFSNGHIATATQTVTVIDQPALTPLPNVSRIVDLGVCTFTNAASSIPNGIATSCSAIASYSYVLTGATTGTVSTLLNQAFNVGVTTITWTATNVNGTTSASSSFTVTVIPIPTVVVPANMNVNTTAGTCDAVVNYTASASSTCNTTTSLENVLASFNANFATTTALIPSAYSFTDGVTGNNISDGGSDMYDGGNQLNTNFASLISYSDNTVINSASFGTNGRYFTRKVNNMFIMAADLGAVTTFSTTGNNGADGSGSAFSSDFVVTSNGIQYKVFYKRVCGAPDPSINQLMIIPNDPAVTQTISTDTNNGLQSISSLNTNRIYYLLFATTSGTCETVATVTNIAQSFLDLNVAAPFTFTLNQTAGLPSGSTFPIGTTTNTFTVTDGSGNVSAPTSFTVTVTSPRELDVLGNSVGIADGDFSPSVADNTDFGNVSTSATLSYTLSNTTGTEAISISSITSSNTNFAVVLPIPTTVAAGSIETFSVTFTPTTTGTQSAIITINNNDCNEAVYDFAVRGQNGVIITPSFPSLPAPPFPRHFTAIAVSTTQINLTWDFINLNITEYELYRDGEFIALLSPSAVSYEDLGLDPDTFYSYTLVAVNRRPGEIRTSEVSTNERTFPEAPVLLSQTDVCGSGSSTVKVSSTGTIHRVYADSVGSTILVETIGAIVVFPSVSETTIFYISVFSNDNESKRTAVTVYVEPSFAATIVGQLNQVSCESTLLLAADSVENARYVWLRNGYEVGRGQVFEATLTGVYQVVVYKGACRIISDEVIVRLNFVPIAFIEQLNDVRFCDAGTINALSTNANATYEWLLNNVVVGTETSLLVSESGTYTLQVTENGCQNTDQIAVIVAPTPQLPVLETSSTTICPYTEIVISVENPENGVIYQWFRNGRYLRQTGSSISTSIQGKYQVLAISEINPLCSNSSEILLIDLFELIPVYLRVSQDRTTLFLEDANLSQNEIVSIEWYFEGEANAALGTSNEITPTEEGYYSARVTTPSGCIIQTRTVYFTVPPIVVTGEEDIKTDMFSIYPNPSTGIFNVRFPTTLTKDMQVSIFDATGKVIKTQIFEKNNQEFVIDIQGFSKGIYLIRFNQDNAIYSKSIILE